MFWHATCWCLWLHKDKVIFYGVVEYSMSLGCGLGIKVHVLGIFLLLIDVICL